jgi:hypothetical protein
MHMLTEADGPLPSSPIMGEVPHLFMGSIEPQTRLFTSPFMGEAGRGPSAGVWHEVPHAR